MTASPGSPRTLQLPAMTRSEAQARTALAQRVRGCPVQWGGAAWSLTLVPSADAGPLQAQAGQWRLQASWGGAPFEFLLPMTAVQPLLVARFPQLDLPSLPLPFTASVLELACADLVEAMGRLQRGPAEFQALSAGPVEGEVGPHVFDLEARSGEQVLRARLSTDTLGMMLMAGLALEQPVAANDMPGDALPVRLRAELGFTWLGVDALRRLAPGDVVLIEHAQLTPQGELWFGAGRWGVRAQYEDGRLVVREPFTPEGITMVDEDTGEQTGACSALDRLLMRVAFDVGERTMTLGELQALHEGQVIELGQPLSTAVSIRVNGSLVGTGELVEVDGRMGVSVTSIFGRNETFEVLGALDGIESMGGLTPGPQDEGFDGIEEDLDEAAGDAGGGPAQAAGHEGRGDGSL